MKKQKKQLILLIILLLVIAAAYIGLKIYNNNHPEEEESAETWPVTQADVSAVTGFSFTNENGSYTFEKREDKWICLEDETADLDTVSMEDMINTAVSVTGTNRMEAVEDMSQYGLDTPEITVTFTTAEGSTTFKTGAYNATVSSYYICLEGDNTVYTIDSATRNSFNWQLHDLKTVTAEETTSDTDTETETG